MRWFVAASLFALGAVAQPLPQGVELIQRIDQMYPWLNVLAFDVDPQGNLYLAGEAQGTIPDAVSFRTGILGERDIVVIKFDPTAQRMVYGVAIGGSKDDSLVRFKVDAAGNAYLVAVTQSVDFPIVFTQGSGNGTIVLKLSPTGALGYSTFLGWASAIKGLDVDASGTVYLSGLVWPGELPASPNAYLPTPPPPIRYAGFVAKLNRSGQNLDAATYVPGDPSKVLHRSNGDVLFASGTAIGALNGLLSQSLFSTDAGIETFFTGSPSGSIDVGQDDLGNIYAAGPKALRKYAADGEHLLFSRDFPTAIFSQFAVSRSGIVYLFGSVPPNFPTRRATQPCRPNLPTSISAGRIGFLMAIGQDGEVLYATYMAEDIPLFLGMPVSSGDGRPYALAQAFLEPNAPNNRWQGIVRFNPDEIPGDHTSAACLTHSATLQITPIAPGTIMALFGDRLGPEYGASFVLHDGRVSFDTGGTSVTVDDKPAPVLYAQSSQVNFITPWSLRTDGATVPVCVTAGGDTSCLYTSAGSVVPGFFSVQQNVIAAINQDGTINSEAHPAKAGSYVSVYFTGGGTLEGAVADGGFAGMDLHRSTAAASASFVFKCLPDCFELSPANAPVLFAGAVPTLVYGVDVAVLQVPSPPVTAINAQLTLRLRPPGKTVDSTASGYLFVSP